MTAHIQFDTPNGYQWKLTKTFQDMRHLDNFIKYICRTKGYLLDEVWHLYGYPFNEGDTYFTLEKVNDKMQVVESVWDDVSEELHNQNPSRFYASSRQDAQNFANGIEKGQVVLL